MARGLRTAARLGRRLGWRTAWDYATKRPFVRFAYGDHDYVEHRDGSTAYHLVESMPKLERLADTLTQADRYVLDAGAHSGLFAAIVLDRHPAATVACIEPDPLLGPTLEANLRGRATVVQAAVGGQAGSATFWRVPSSTQTSSLDEQAARAFGDAESVTIDVVTIDDVVASLGWPRVDVLKLDVQGAESAALDGAAHVLPRLSSLLIELTFLDPDPRGLMNRLSEEFDTEPVVVNLVYSGADLLYRRNAAPPRA